MSWYTSVPRPPSVSTVDSGRSKKRHSLQSASAVKVDRREIAITAPAPATSRVLGSAAAANPNPGVSGEAPPVVASRNGAN